MPNRLRPFAYIVFAEKSYDRLGTPGLDLAQRVALADKLTTARDVAGVSVYGQHIQTILDELPPLEKWPERERLLIIQT